MIALHIIHDVTAIIQLVSELGCPGIELAAERNTVQITGLPILGANTILIEFVRFLLTEETLVKGFVIVEVFTST